MGEREERGGETGWEWREMEGREQERGGGKRRDTVCRETVKKKWINLKKKTSWLQVNKLGFLN